MAVTQITDVVVPEAFTSYVVENTMESSALVQSGVAVRNAAIEAQLTAGAEAFTVPHWLDLGNDEANIVNDDPEDEAVPHKVAAGKTLVRKCFLHNSWSSMNLASELADSDAIARIQSRAAAYWTRQLQRRLVSTLNGVLADNVAANDDLILDISDEAGAAGIFSASAVIDAAGTMGDAAGGLVGIAMHSATYRVAQKADLIDFVPDSQGTPIATYRGLAVIVDDMMPVLEDTAGDVYTTALFGAGAIAYGVTAPRIAAGTEVENRPGAGNGGGQQILHSRVNLAIAPSGYSWVEGSVAGDSPTIAELALAANWLRVATERKQVPLAFLRHRIE